MTEQMRRAAWELREWLNRFDYYFEQHKLDPTARYTIAEVRGYFNEGWNPEQAAAKFLFRIHAGY